MNRADNGLKGESDVLDVLMTLPNEYFVFRGSRPTGSWDIDLVVVGPTGVFTIEVKSHIGKIGYDGNQLTINGREFREKDFLKQAISQAYGLREVLRKQLQRDIFITPYIVFSSQRAFVRLGQRPIKGVCVIRKDWLCEMLTRNTGTNFANTDTIVNALKSLLSVPRIGG
jgi:hypothetical protein